MKSADYSAKGVFFSVFKSVARRQLPGAIVISVICACMSVVSALLYCTNAGFDQDISYGVFAWGAYVLFAVSVYCAVSVGVMYNAFFSRRACDYHLSLPYKRSQIYNANFLFGLLAIVFSVIISSCVFAAVAGITESVYSSTHSATISFTIEYDVIIKKLVTLFAALLAGYSACSMCAAVAGRWIQYAAFCFICIISTPVMLIGIASRINVVWGVMVDIFRFTSITPVGVTAMMLREPPDNVYIFMSVVSLIEFAAMYAAGLVSFMRRKAEIAESSQGGSFVKYILMVVFVISGFVYFNASKNFFTTAVTGIITAFICAVLFSAGQVRRKKILTKQTGIIFGSVAAVCLVFTACVYFANSSSYVKYVPKAEDVQSVTVTEYDYFSGYANENLWFIMELFNGESSSVSKATLDEPQNIQAVIDFHTRAVSDEVRNYTFKDKISDSVTDTLEETTTVSENASADEETTSTSDYFDITDTISCAIEYKLKDGRTVKRSYTIDYDLWKEFIAIFKNKEALMQQEPFSYNTDEIIYVEGVSYSYDEDISGDYYTNENFYVISPQEWENIRDVIVEDKINETDYNFKYGYDGAGYFTVCTLSPDLPQKQKELILSMTPRERYEYVANYNRLMLLYPEEYAQYPINEYSVNILLDDENTVKLIQSPDMQKNIVQ